MSTTSPDNVSAPAALLAGGAPSAAAVPAAPPPRFLGLPALAFGTHWRQYQWAEIIPGENLTIAYDQHRIVPPDWIGMGSPDRHIVGFVRFRPCGVFVYGNLAQPADDDPFTLELPTSLAISVLVPSDADEVEIWFRQIDSFGWSIWDTRGGEHYRFAVGRRGDRTRVQELRRRDGAIVSPAVVNVFEHDLGEDLAEAVRGAIKPTDDGEGKPDWVLAWVSDIGHPKDVWVDMHLYDSDGWLVESRTESLCYLTSRSLDEEFYLLRDTPTAPRASELRFRLYYGVNGHVYTDGPEHARRLVPGPGEALVASRDAQSA